MKTTKTFHKHGSAPNLISLTTGGCPQNPRAATVCPSYTGKADMRSLARKPETPVKLPALVKPAAAGAILQREFKDFPVHTKGIDNGSITLLSPHEFPSPCQRKEVPSPFSRKAISPDSNCPLRKPLSPSGFKKAGVSSFSLEEYKATILTEFGGQGKVWQGTHPVTCQKVAIKETDVSDQGKKLNYQREVEVYKAIKKAGGHPNLCTALCSSSSATYSYLVLPFYQCDLFSALKACGKGQPSVANRITQKILDAVGFLHNTVQYAHRDIKPENVLMTSNNVETADIVLCDFGLAGNIQQRGTLTAKCGSKHYMAPELFDENQAVYDAPKVDLWAIGMVYFVGCCGFYPWPKAETNDAAFKAFSKEDQTKFYSWVDKHATTPTTPIFRIVFSGLCNIDPLKRMSVEMAKECLKKEAKLLE